DETLQVFRPGTSVQRERSAGACNATFDLAGALMEGDAAGRAAAVAAGFASPVRARGSFSSPLVGEGQGGGAPSPTALAGDEGVSLDGQRDPPSLPAPTRADGGANAKAPSAVPPIRADRRAKAFVDFQNDVCAKDVSLAVQEGMRSIEHIKRYTTTGMATDQ